MWIDADLSCLDCQSTVVLANNRQVLAFKKTFAQSKPNQQLPRIFTWHQYLQNLWISYNTDEKRLINPSEYRYLITGILQEDGQNPSHSLVSEVVKNHNYCANHLINLDILLASKVSISTLFVKWVQAYKALKTQHHLLDINDLPEQILKVAPNITTPYIYGFKTFTPQQQLFFNTIGFQSIEPKASTQSIKTFTFDTLESEILKVAHWAKSCTVERPNDSIVVVSPQLQTLQHQFKSIFDAVFDDLLRETGQKSYNISLGLSLTQYPLIQDLLRILTLNEQIQTDNIQTELFNKIITSPYLVGYQTECFYRHTLVNKVLDLSCETLSLKKLTTLSEQCPILNAVIQKITQQNSIYTSLDRHLTNFNAALDIWGFGNDRDLNSQEYQLFKKYLSVSLGLNQRAQYSGKTNERTAINELKSLLLEVVFQPQSSTANIQIMGALEAEGLRFHQAWVLGVNADFLPAKLNLPRFIDHTISVQHQVPFSSFELINIDANKTLVNLSALANSVTFSYAEMVLDEAQMPSPLLNFPSEVSQFITKINSPITLQSLIDTQANALQNLNIHQGVATLKNQMACAFSGFANRLNLSNFDAPHLGINKREQGNVTHQALHKIYQKYPSKSAISSLDDTALEALILQEITQALENHPNNSFKTIEQQRLLRLIQGFIAIDKQRDDFEVVALEKDSLIEIEGLSFQTRLDRMDELTKGERIIFDYKTGKTAPSSWCGETHIKEPQLPIYAINNLVSGCGFIELRSEKIVIKGISKSGELLPQKTKGGTCQAWDEQIKIWHTQLTQASLDFQAGFASVLPTKNACDYCHLSNLCRVEKQLN
jgi:probable DNA repair protein